MRRTSFAVVAALCGLAVVAAGCGSDGDSDKGGSTSAGSTNASSTSGNETNVTARDLSFSTKKIDAKAGKVKVTLDNQGQAPHEFVVIKTDAAPDALKTKGGEADETGSVGEIPETEGGQKASGEFDLKPGHYVFICNVPSHYKAGMAGEIDVK